MISDFIRTSEFFFLNWKVRETPVTECQGGCLLWVFWVRQWWQAHWDSIPDIVLFHRHADPLHEQHVNTNVPEWVVCEVESAWSRRSQLPKLAVDFPFNWKQVLSSFLKFNMKHVVHVLFLYDGLKGRCQESSPNELATVGLPKKPKVDTLPSTL